MQFYFALLLNLDGRVITKISHKKAYENYFPGTFFDTTTLENKSLDW